MLFSLAIINVHKPSIHCMKYQSNLNKANRPKMRPRRCAIGGVRCAVMAAVVMVVVAVVVLVVVRESHPLLEKFNFSVFLKKGNGHTDGRTDPLIEMRGRI